MLVALALIGSMAVVLAACTSTPSPPAYPLPTSPGDSCAGVGVASLILHGRLVDGVAQVWANDDIAIRWPIGYRARFEPTLVVVDARGVIRGREGEEMATAEPWHGQYVCPEHSPSDVGFGPLVVTIYLLSPPPPTPEGSRPCSAVTADLRAALATLRADAEAMVGGATDGATRNRLASDASQTLDELNRHPDCYPAARLAVWQADLGYLSEPWRPNFRRVDALQRVTELEGTPLE